MDYSDGIECEYYDNSKCKLCYIINNEEFLPIFNLSTRTGSKQDLIRLQATFRNLNFKVETAQNRTCGEILNDLKSLSQRKDLMDVSVFVCVILTHGVEGFIYGTDGMIKLEKIFGFFKGDICKYLRGKPKIFFIQACRGDKFDSGVQLDSIESNNIETIPIEADFLIGYSTVPGYFSWRNSVNGSWFIQALCDELEKWGKKHEIIQILVKVNNNVASNFKSHSVGANQQASVQIPSFVCMLRKPTIL